MSEGIRARLPAMEIHPYHGVGALEFGMSQSAVEMILGAPTIAHADHLGNHRALFGALSAFFQDGVLVEVGMVPESNAVVLGLAPFSDPDAFGRLCELDGDPKETLGFIVLLQLGITLTGFHDNDESQRAITAFVRGRWDALRSDMRDFA